MTSEAASTSPRRSYDSPVREQQAAQTRERILAAGAELAHGLSRWDWRDLTVRAVAERAEVHPRTVYRHFASERELRDAIMEQLVEEAGVRHDQLEVDTFAALTEAVYAYLSSFPASPGDEGDPTFSHIDQARRASLAAAVARAAPDWSEREHRLVTAALDVFWSVPTFERLVGTWELDGDEAARVASWVIGLVRQAIEDDRRPTAD